MELCGKAECGKFVSCKHELFPFHNVKTTAELYDIFVDTTKDNTPRTKHCKCGVCGKRIRKNVTVANCCNCSKYFHLKCEKHSKGELLQLNWQCCRCTIKSLPFSEISDENLKLTTQGFNDKTIDSVLQNTPSFSMKSLLDQFPGKKIETDEFMNDTVFSKYYTVDEFASTNFSSKSFSIYHLNIASLQKHIDELRILLSCTKHNFDIICITETRLHCQESFSNIQIDGYEFIHMPTSTLCGGVGMYIKSGIEYHLLKNLTSSHENVCESIFVELKHPSKKHIIIGTIYRHHDSVETFLDTYFRKTLQTIIKTKKKCIIAGDFNIDLIKYGENTSIDAFYDELSSYCFRPLILQPTRVTSRSLSLIDNIFTNDVSSFSMGGNLTSYISDHFSQFVQLDIFGKIHQKKEVKFGRNWGIFNKNEFEEEISACTWDNVISPNIDTNKSVSNFYNQIEKLLDEMAPLKKLTKKQISLQQHPWISKDITLLMTDRDKFYKDFIKEGDPLIRNEKYKLFKIKRNLVTSKLRKTIEQKIPKGTHSFTEYLGDRNIYNIVLHPCTDEEVRKYISMLAVSKAAGPNSIPVHILNNYTDQLIKPLTVILNKSLKEGVFPDLLKPASVCPIYKKNDQTKCANYRPISLLSNLSKIFERTMYNRIELFLSEFETIYNLQFGFRKKHSTEHALISIIEQIRWNLNHGIYSCGVFVDLEKAFDTVNHNILLSKLEHYGIRDNAFKWIKSYLSERTQFVKLNGVCSENQQICCGVPQGSILGPLLFIIYINDMHNSIKISTVHHFADDTNLLFSSKNIKEIKKTLNNDLKLLYEWLCANRLSLNVAKTEFLVFRPPQKKLNERLVLRLNGSNIFESSKIIYLGVILDSRLRWKHHINELTKKLSRAVGMIYKIRNDCTKHVLLSLYYSIFHSQLSYGLLLWGKSSDSYLSKIILLQKKVIRAITFSDSNAHTSPLFKHLNILSVKDLLNYKIMAFMWDFEQKTLPKSLTTLFIYRNHIHTRNLRDNNKNKIYTAQRYQNRHGYDSLSHQGALLLNKAKDLPCYQHSLSKKCFLKKYKSLILNGY